MDDLKECREAFEAWQRGQQGWLYNDEAEKGTFQEDRWIAWQAAWNRRAVPQTNAEQGLLLERERRDAQSLASLLVKERRRFEFLHSTNCDAEGWEWGVARIRVNEYGECEYLWGVADHSDIDAAIAAAPQVSKGSEHPANNEREYESTASKADLRTGL